MSHWTALDFLFAGIIILSTVVAFFKGLTRELISLGALIIGFVAAAFYYPRAGAWFIDLTSSETVANLVGFMIVFLGCLIAGALIAYAVKRFIKLASLDWVDRLLGGIFGFLRGCALSSIIVLALIAFPVRESRLARSVLGPYLLAGARAAVLLVPQDLKDKFREGYKKVLDALTQPESKT
ncbi:MAG: CvpA family protein [Acidobacteria bacterium]|nr:CvpA family protein [Acidobacteriota bacterium]